MVNAPEHSKFKIVNLSHSLQLLDNYIYVAIGTSFCVLSEGWGGAMTDSQGGESKTVRAIHAPSNPAVAGWAR